MNSNNNDTGNKDNDGNKIGFRLISDWKIYYCDIKILHESTPCCYNPLPLSSFL
jgi:hypothetical protein